MKGGLANFLQPNAERVRDHIALSPRSCYNYIIPVKEIDG